MINAETEPATRKRLEEIERELADLREKQHALKAQWSTEKDTIQKIRTLKAQIEQAKNDAIIAERDGNLAKVAEIRYGTMTQLERAISVANDKLNEVQKAGKMLKEEVGPEDIAEIVAKWTGIPVQKMLESERTKLLKMEDRLHNRVIGQEEAVSAVSDAIRRNRADLQDPNRPIGSFIFLGTTGVGKTELARALAEFLFDDEKAMVRIDMSEYMENFAVSRLLGAPPGYVGYEEGGQLTESVRNHPYTVVLLDEIEKAHPDVFNVLLQVLDEGRLTDSQGRTVNFKNTIIIMTSNLGTEIMQNRLTEMTEMNRERMLETMKREIMKMLQQRVRPEFLNRIDDVILFNPLTRKEIRQIAGLQIQKIERSLTEKGVKFKISDKALDWIAEHGYDVQYGARPLKRVIQKNIGNPLAMKILAGEFAEADTVYIDVDIEGELLVSSL